MGQLICILEQNHTVQQRLTRELAALDWVVDAYEDAYPLFDNPGYLPDVFLINIHLRGLNGMEICKWLKGRPETSHTPVILVSDAPELLVLAANYPADGILTKPFTTVRLLEMVHEVMTIGQEL